MLLAGFGRLLFGVALAWLVVLPLVMVLGLAGSAGGLTGGEAYRQLTSAGGELGRLLGNSLIFGVGSATLALGLGVALAWLAECTDAPGRRLAYGAAWGSLAVPGLVKTIGWILLTGPRAGLLNLWLVEQLGLPGPPFNVFSLPGMIAVEGLLWAPVVFLLLAPTLRSLDPQFGEAGRVLGASGPQVFATITLPLLRPTLLALLLLTLVRTLESFEVPAILGGPAGVPVLTSEVFFLIQRGATRRDAEASAYATVLLLVVGLALSASLYLTRVAERFRLQGASGYRAGRARLGRGRLLGGLALGLPAMLLALPLLALAWASLLPFVQPPSPAALAGLSLENYTEALGGRDLGQAVRNSLLVSPLAATLALALGLGSAWQLTQTRLPERWLTNALAALPLALPGVVLGLALLRLYAGLPGPVYGTLGILVIALTTRALPYSARLTHAALLGLPPSLVEAARVHGAGRLLAARTVVAPLLAPALGSAWLYGALLTLRELSSVVLLTSPGSELVAVRLWELWQGGRVGVLGAFGVLLCLALTPGALVLAQISRRLDRR